MKSVTDEHVKHRSEKSLIVVTLICGICVYLWPSLVLCYVAISKPVLFCERWLTSPWLLIRLQRIDLTVALRYLREKLGYKQRWNVIERSPCALGTYGLVKS